MIDYLKMFGAMWLGALVAAILCYSLAVTSGGDDTDGEKRSGVILRTDYGTGCQYLESVKGHLTPRLKPDGSVFCILKGAT